MKRYKHRPTIVEAVQFTGDNMQEVLDFLPSLYINPKNYKDYIGYYFSYDFEDDWGCAMKPELFEQLYEECEE